MFTELFNQVDQLAEGRLNTLIEESPEQLNHKEHIKQLYSIAEEWSCQANSFLDNQTPVEFASKLGFDEAVKFALAAFESGYGLTDSICNALKQHSKLLLESLKNEHESIVLRKPFDENKFYCFSTILSKQKDLEAMHEFISFILRVPTEEEDIAEYTSNMLENYKELSMPHLVKAVSGKYSGRVEYFYAAIANIGEFYKNEDAYVVLKEFFRKSSCKLLPAMCLGDYGDPRAIPVLRGQVERNRSKLKAYEYNEILAAIKKLGGNISDLQ